MEKLQELCLDKIAASFEIYYHAYSKSPNEALKKGILFLQKVYSDKLILRLYKKGLMQEKYVHLVFTKYLKALNTEWLANCSWRTIVETFARIGPGLEIVDFNQDEVPWKDVVCHLPNVTTIDYSFCCTDEFLQRVAEYCPRLERLQLYKSYDVTDVGFKYLCQRKRGVKRKTEDNCLVQNSTVPCPLLKEIYAKRVEIGVRCIQQLLRNLPLLESFQHEEIPSALYSMHKKDLKSLHKVRGYNLKCLNFMYYPNRNHKCPYGDILKICFNVCPKLKNVYLTIQNSEQLNYCSLLTDLQDLTIECVADRDFLMDPPVSSRIDINSYLRENGEMLESLTLYHCTVSLHVLEQHCLHLNKLSLKCTTIQYDEENSVPVCSTLKTFIIQDAKESDNCQGIYTILKSSPGLEGLYVFFCAPTSDLKAAILKCCEQSPLKHISISGSFDVEFLKDVLLTCTTLKSISCRFVEELYKIAQTLPNIPEIRH